LEIKKDSQKEYFFSVIIPTYNREKLILRALTSLLSQTEKNFEAIIIDDGSTDNTYTVIKEIFLKNYNFIYICNSNHGLAFSRNLGMNHASGKYITFLDSDDEYEPDHLETRKKILSENHDIELLHGGLKIIGNQDIPDKNNPVQSIHVNDCIVGGTFFIKREA